MKAISIKEPWAGMIAEGKKTIETRTWNTNYRGKIIIVASKVPRTKNSGKAIAIAEIYDCKPMTKEHEKDACCPVYDRAKSWFLRNVKKIEPFEVKGKLGIYELDCEGKI